MTSFSAARLVILSLPSLSRTSPGVRLIHLYVRVLALTRVVCEQWNRAVNLDDSRARGVQQPEGLGPLRTMIATWVRLCRRGYVSLSAEYEGLVVGTMGRKVRVSQQEERDGLSCLPSCPSSSSSFQAFEVWSSVLRSLPDSRLLVKARPFADVEMRRKFVEKFERQGISSDRIDTMALIPSCADHLMVSSSSSSSCRLSSVHVKYIHARRQHPCLPLYPVMKSRYFFFVVRSCDFISLSLVGQQRGHMRLSVFAVSLSLWKIITVSSEQSVHRDPCIQLLLARRGRGHCMYTSTHDRLGVYPHQSRIDGVSLSAAVARTRGHTAESFVLGTLTTDSYPHLRARLSV